MPRPRAAWEQALALAARGHTVAIGVPHSRVALKDEERRDNVTIFRFGDYKRRAEWGRSIADIMETPRFIKQMLAGARWDVLIAHHPHVAYGALRVHMARRLPFIYIFHASAAAEIQYEGLSRPGLWPLAALFLKPSFVSFTRWIEKRVLRHARAVGVFSDFSSGFRYVDSDVEITSADSNGTFNDGNDTSRLFNVGSFKKLSCPQSCRILSLFSKTVDRFWFTYLRNTNFSRCMD